MRLVLNSKKKAQSLIEYALILAMVAVVAVAALQLLGNNLGSALRQASDSVAVGANQAGEQACNAMGENFSWDAENSKCIFNDSGDSSSGGE